MPSPDALHASIVSLGFDLFAMKLYWVAVCALWLVEYFQTLPAEIEYAWKGRKTIVFYLFLVNRYFPFYVIVITQVAYFSKSFTSQVCSRYGFMETFETMVLTAVAEIFLTLRVYALAKKHKAVLFVSGAIQLWQIGIAIYAMSQTSKGTDLPAVLLSRRADLPPLPTLPSIDPYHLCISISTLTVKPWVEAYLCLSLSFDALAFLSLTLLTMRASRSHYLTRIIKVIRNDGILYFFVLFSSNLIWLLLLIYARPGLKFIHNEPAMIISSIMINRITLNLKRASLKDSITAIPWGLKTFEDRHEDSTLGSSAFSATLRDENSVELRNMKGSYRG